MFKFIIGLGIGYMIGKRIVKNRLPTEKNASVPGLAPDHLDPANHKYVH